MSGGVEEGKDHLPGMLLGDQEASEKTGCVVGHYLKGRISVCTLREDVFFLMEDFLIVIYSEKAKKRLTFLTFVVEDH